MATGTPPHNEVSPDDVTTTKWPKIALIVLAIIAIVLLVWLCTKPGSPPSLAVTYLTTAMDQQGRCIARFGITNTGRSSVYPGGLGQIEIPNTPKPTTVLPRGPRSKLSPGKGHVVDVVISDSVKASLNGKWRFSCLYSPVSLRSTIYTWQWGPGGPGPRANWLVPQCLKGMPLTAKGTSDWIDGFQQPLPFSAPSVQKDTSPVPTF